MTEATAELLTIGDIARITGAKKHQVGYALDQYNVEPHCRIGIIRCWRRDQLPHITSIINRVASNRGLAHAC